MDEKFRKIWCNYAEQHKEILEKIEYAGDSGITFINKLSPNVLFYAGKVTSDFYGIACRVNSSVNMDATAYAAMNFPTFAEYDCLVMIGGNSKQETKSFTVVPKEFTQAAFNDVAISLVAISNVLLEESD